MRKKSSPVVTVASIWLFPLLILMLSSQACDHAYKKTEAPTAAGAADSEDVSLKADRSAYDKLRSEIPKDQRNENDELALVLQSIHKNSAADEDPAKIRDRFGKVMRDRRAAHDKQLRARRDEFSKADKSKRDAFLNGLKDDRATFMNRLAKKASVGERQAFFSGQEQKRQAYFSAESDRRREFESTITEQRKTFEDGAREATNKFNEEMRAYTTTYFERKKVENLKKSAEKKALANERKAKGLNPEPAAIPKGVTEEGRQLLQQFDDIPATPGVRLGPGDQ